VKTAELAAAEGADLVIGTHPHVLQPITMIPTERGQTLVAYSLGNFIANQIKAPRERSVVLAVEFEKLPEGGTRLFRASVAPIVVSSSCQKGHGCTIQLVYGGQEPEAAEPATFPTPKETGEGPGLQPDGDGGQLHSLLLYDSPAGGELAVSVVSGSSAYAAGAVVTAEGFVDAMGASPLREGNRDAGSGERGGVRRRGGGKAAAGEVGEGFETGLPALPEREIGKALRAGERILEFLGAGGDPDELGYYTIWDSSAPDDLPVGIRKSPN
jgi:hypothetical protein